MASFPTSAPRLGASLDWALSAFAAGAAGFALFAMPTAMFSGLVEASGLPGLVAAAQPPLGTTARLAAVAATVMGTFGLVWLLLRALDRPATQPSPSYTPGEVEEEPAPVPQVPRLRRFDAHPDAPARRPIFAARDLGEPQPEPGPAVEEELVLDETYVEPEPAPEPQFEAEPVPEPEPETAAAPSEALKPEPRLEEMPAASGSIAGLMHRLEGGLLRRSKEPAIASPAPPIEEQRAEGQGHRLRSALNDLQKISGGA